MTDLSKRSLLQLATWTAATAVANAGEVRREGEPIRDAPERASASSRRR